MIRGRSKLQTVVKTGELNEAQTRHIIEIIESNGGYVESMNGHMLIDYSDTDKWDMVANIRKEIEKFLGTTLGCYNRLAFSFAPSNSKIDDRSSIVFASDIVQIRRTEQRAIIINNDTLEEQRYIEGAEVCSDADGAGYYCQKLASHTGAVAVVSLVKVNSAHTKATIRIHVSSVRIGKFDADFVRTDEFVFSNEYDVPVNFEKGTPNSFELYEKIMTNMKMDNVRIFPEFIECIEYATIQLLSKFIGRLSDGFPLDIIEDMKVVPEYPSNAFFRFDNANLVSTARFYGFSPKPNGFTMGKYPVANQFTKSPPTKSFPKSFGTKKPEATPIRNSKIEFKIGTGETKQIIAPTRYNDLLKAYIAAIEDANALAGDHIINATNPKSVRILKSSPAEFEFVGSTPEKVEKKPAKHPAQKDKSVEKAKPAPAATPAPASSVSIPLVIGGPNCPPATYDQVVHDDDTMFDDSTPLDGDVAVSSVNSSAQFKSPVIQ